MYRRWIDQRAASSHRLRPCEGQRLPNLGRAGGNARRTGHILGAVGLSQRGRSGGTETSGGKTAKKRTKQIKKDDHRLSMAVRRRSSSGMLSTMIMRKTFISVPTERLCGQRSCTEAAAGCSGNIGRTVRIAGNACYGKSA